jgi:hypothetical protein
MQKQVKKNYRKYNNNKKQTFKKLRMKALFKKYGKSKHFGRPFKKYRKFLSKNFIRLSVTIKPNNIFCSLKHNKKNFVLKSISSGSYKVKTTRKRLKYNTKTVLNLFFRDLKQRKIAFSKFIIISVIAPIRIRKQIINLIAKSFLRRTLKKRRIIIDVPQLKAFNGCRPVKKQRKKRKGFKLYK